MTRWALVLLASICVGSAYGMDVPGAPSWATTPTATTNVELGDTGENYVNTFAWKWWGPDGFGWYYVSVTRAYCNMATGSTTTGSSTKTELSAQSAWLDARWAEWWAGIPAECETAELEEWFPYVPDPELDWTCKTHLVYTEHEFCARFTPEDTVEWYYTLPCVSDNGVAESPEGLEADFRFWDQTICPGDEPEPYEPPSPSVECTGAEGVACEDTQRRNELLLAEIRDLLAASNQGNQAPPEVAPEPDYHVPTFDPLDPDWEDFVVPDAPDGALAGYVARIEAAVDDLVSTASGKFPFGLGGYVPTVGLVEVAPCVDFELTLFGSVEAVGWCGSPVESALAGVGRAATLFLATIALAYAVVKTMAFA